MTISKYIFKKWIMFALIVFAILVLLIAIIEIITDVMRNSGTLVEIVIKFFIYLPEFFNKIFPITGAVASFLLVQSLRDKNELLGMLISGFTFGKVIGVVLLAAVLLSSIQFLGSAYLWPWLWEKRRDVLHDGDQKFRGFYDEDMFSKSFIAGRMWYKNDKYFLSFVYMDKAKKELIKPTVYFYKNELTEVIIAEKATLAGDGNWVFSQGETWNLISGYPKIEEFAEKSKIMEESFDDFGQMETDIKILSFPELIDYVDNLKGLGINVNEFEVFMYEKVAASFPTVAFALLPLLGIFSLTRRVGKQVYLVAIFGTIFVYWLASSYLLELGRYGRINPLIAAFSVQIILLMAIIYPLVIRSRR